MAGRIGSTSPMPMNAITHENATAQTAFGCFRIEPRMPRARRSRDRRPSRRRRGRARGAVRTISTALARVASSSASRSAKVGVSAAASSSRQASRAARPRGSAEISQARASLTSAMRRIQPRSSSVWTSFVMVGCDTRLTRASSPRRIGPRSRSTLMRAPDGGRLGAAGDGCREPREPVVHRDEVAEDGGEVCWRGHRASIHSLHYVILSSESPFSRIRAIGMNSPTSRLRDPVIVG